MIAQVHNGSDARRAFQKLKTRLHARIVETVDLTQAGELDEPRFREQLRALAAYVCEVDEMRLDPAQREAMVREILDEIYGFGPLELLMHDAGVTDILVNGPDSVLIERNGRLERTDVRFAGEEHLLGFIRRLVARAGRRIDDVSPMVDARLADGSRLHAVIPPLALRGPTLSIRRFSPAILSLSDLVARGTLASDMAEFLRLAVQGRLNVLLSGGTGAGKTTMLNSLGRLIPESERVVTIEETAELRLGQPDVIALEARPANIEGRGEITQRDLLRNCVRMRPDRIIVGEARGGEVFELLQAMNTGHDGSMSTVNANDTRDALARLEMMVALSGADLPAWFARDYIASAIHVLVHVTRLASGERKVTRISELCGCENGGYVIEDVFVCRMSGFDASGRSRGTFYATGYEPVCLQRLAAAGVELPPDLFAPRELDS